MLHQKLSLKQNSERHFTVVKICGADSKNAGQIHSPVRAVGSCNQPDSASFKNQGAKMDGWRPDIRKQRVSHCICFPTVGQPSNFIRALFKGVWKNNPLVKPPKNRDVLACQQALLLSGPSTRPMVLASYPEILFPSWTENCTLNAMCYESLC